MYWTWNVFWTVTGQSCPNDKKKHPGLGFYRRIMDIVVWEGLKLRAKQQTFIRQNLPEINDHTVNFQNPYHPCMENLPTRGKCRKIYHTYIHGAYEYTKHMGFSSNTQRPMTPWRLSCHKVPKLDFQRIGKHQRPPLTEQWIETWNNVLNLILRSIGKCQPKKQLP